MNTKTKTMKLELKTDELELIETSKAESIRKTFEPMVALIKGFEGEFDEVIAESQVEVTDSLTDLARDLRIKISKVRINTEKVRKSQKEEFLRAGKAIDGVANIIKWAVADKEEKLKDIEDHFERIEKQRLTDLQFKRWDELKKYLPEDFYEKDLSSMDDDVWNAYLSQKKQDHLDLSGAKKQAELDLAAKEKEDEEERLRIISENKKLKKEAEERERLAKIEAEKREKVEAQRIAKEEAERKEREEYQRKEREAFQLKLNAEREERERVEREEKVKRETLEAQLKAKLEDEAKAKEEEETRIQTELNKGDSDKVNDLKSDLIDLKAKYSFKSKKNQKMYNDVSVLIDKVINHITK